MRRNSSAPARRGARAAATAVVLGALAAPAIAFPTAAGAASGDDFTVERLDTGGWKVTLELAAPLPVRDAVTELAVDGVVVGAARESADGKRLTVETADPSVARAREVEVAYNGAVPSAATTAPRSPAAPVTPRGQAKKHVSTDPATPGPYGVARSDYDLGDTATTLSGLSDLPVEVRAAVYAPVQAKGRRPVVVFLHGRHAACYNPVTRTSNNTSWPCAPGFQPIQSYLGYGETAENLATHGYVVVSISANGINAKDATSTDDNGGLARGQLVMQHLDLLAQAQAGDGPAGTSALAGRLDLTNVGMMGHSRGGEGVVEAALLNAERPSPYGVRAVLPLAPVDFARATLPDVPMAVVLPYCDGDVSNQQGQHFYDDSRYTTDDDVLRSSLMVMGADHNFFNTEWTPGVSVAPSSDDWSAAADEVCGAASPSRLTAAEQRAVGTAYMAGFFRLAQGGETAFLPLFDGTGGTVPSTGRAVVLTQAQQPGSRRYDVAPLEAPSPQVRLSGFGSAAYCSSVAIRVPAGGTACSSTPLTSKVPHWTPATYATWVPTSPVLRLQWDAATAAGASVQVAVDRNVKKYEALSFRTARDESAVGDVDLAVTVVDGKGRTFRTQVAASSGALTPLPASTNTVNGRNLLGKTWLRTVRIPTSAMGALNLNDVRTVTVTPATPTGGAYLSDVAFDSVGIGSGGPTDLPQLSIADTTVAEGDGPGTAAVRLVLDAPLTATATVNVQTAATGSSTAGQVPAAWIPVVLAPGTTSVTVPVPLAGNTVVNAAARYKTTLSASKGAVIGDGFAWLTVTDDDGPAV